VRYVERWSSFHVMHKESVAEHSFFTAFYCLILGRWLQMEGHTINLGLLLGRAIMHDVDEAFSGDFIRSFKHSSPDLAAMLHEAAKAFHMQLCKRLTKHENLRFSLHDYWVFAKHVDLEGRILAFADFLSVLSYALMERRVGNTLMNQQETDLLGYGELFLTNEYEFLDPYPREAYLLMKEVLA